MRTCWLTLPAALFTLFLASCGNSTGPQGTTGTGPFDANGNYVESWADSPSKWGKGRGGSSSDQAEIVALQAPLMGGGRSSGPVTPVEQPPIVRQTPPPVIASNQPKPRPVSRVTEDNDRPTKSKAVAQNTTKSKAAAAAAAANATKSKNSKTQVATTKGKTPPKTKAVAAVKVKPKPTSSRYAVRQGDSLYAIAKRYGTTAGAIQKANGLSGTMIRPGQSLVIPR